MTGIKILPPPNPMQPTFVIDAKNEINFLFIPLHSSIRVILICIDCFQSRITYIIARFICIYKLYFIFFILSLYELSIFNGFTTLFFNLHFIFPYLL